MQHMYMFTGNVVATKGKQPIYPAESRGQILEA